MERDQIFHERNVFDMLEDMKKLKLERKVLLLSLLCYVIVKASIAKTKVSKINFFQPPQLLIF